MKSIAKVIIVLLACMLSNPSQGEAPPSSYDLAIVSGLIIDGSEESAFMGDVAIRDDRIVAIGKIDVNLARVVIDASGLIVAPGFIDMAGPTAIQISENPEVSLNLLKQGITTINVTPATQSDIASGVGRRTLAGDFLLLNQKGLPINVSQAIDYDQVRQIVMGELGRSATSKELQAMQELVKQAMATGASGFSTTLNSFPVTHTQQTKEIFALAQIAGKYGGSYFTHLRGEGNSLLELIDEAIAIGKTADIPVHILYLEATGKGNEDTLRRALSEIQAARDRGEQVSADLNPSRQAISQATVTIANAIQAKNRGRIAVGFAADLIVFDDKILLEKTSSTRLQNHPDTIKHVIINGIMALRDGKRTDNRSGRVLRGPGYQEKKAPHHITAGATDEQFAQIDSIIKKCLAKHHVPGVALAITDHGRLVYSRGFGYADIETQQPVMPTTLFRIASLSKSITAVAIMQLIEAEKLKLETPVFSILNNYEPFLEGDAKPDDRMGDITIRHLLQHRGGWDRGASFDPMFRSAQIAKSLDSTPPAKRHEIIRYMQGRKLDFTPGERYVYSNYGYCLLGRVIEKLSGKTYENHVQENVLKPLGITTMKIGSSAPQLDRPGETYYYDPYFGRSVFDGQSHQRVSQPYGAWDLEAMDSHGGWIATAADLVKFAAAFDTPEDCPLLTASSIQQMFERPPGLAGWSKKGKANSIYYGLGWQVRNNVFSKITLQMHAGSLPGTSTMLVRRSDGRCFAILFNARKTPFTFQPVYEIFNALNEAIGKIDNWPTTDLFSE